MQSEDHVPLIVSSLTQYVSTLPGLLFIGALRVEM